MTEQQNRAAMTNATVSARARGAAAIVRPIIGIENRTAQEVFDIMCDRFKGHDARLIAEIREECAQIAEDLANSIEGQSRHPQPLPIDTNEGWRRVHDAALDIATAIRKGPQP